MRYEIQGDTLPVVICYLDGGEKMITEKGAMSWMSPKDVYKRQVTNR